MNAIIDRPTTTTARLEMTFNTGRGYTHHGQHIAVWTLELSDGQRCFVMNDYDRHVMYTIKHDPDLETEGDMRRYVMWAYDKHLGCEMSGDLYRAARELVAAHPVHTLQFRACVL